MSHCALVDGQWVTPLPIDGHITMADGWIDDGFWLGPDVGSAVFFVEEVRDLRPVVRTLGVGFEQVQCGLKLFFGGFFDELGVGRPDLVGEGGVAGQPVDELGYGLFI